MSRNRLIVAFVTLVLPLLIGVLSSDVPYVRHEFAYAAPVPHRPLDGGTNPTASASGSAPLSPLVLAAIWVGVIASMGSVVAVFVRFYRKHNEHLTFDDHPGTEIWARGLESYLRLTGREKDEEESAQRAQ